MEIKEIFPTVCGVVLTIILVFLNVANVIGSWSITVMAILTGAIISLSLSVLVIPRMCSGLNKMSPKVCCCPMEYDSSSHVKSLWE